MSELLKMPKLDYSNDYLNLAHQDKFETLKIVDYCGPQDVAQYILENYALRIEAYKGDLYHDFIELYLMAERGDFPISYKQTTYDNGRFLPFCISIRKTGTRVFKEIFDLVSETKRVLKETPNSFVESLVFQIESEIAFQGATNLVYNLRIARLLIERL